jgi:O-antigen ligase
MPEHENTFLFCIGVFTLYLIMGGYLALRYKQKTVNLLADKMLSTTMLITGIGMIAYPIIQFGQFNIVLGVFGMIGIAMSIIDFARYRNKAKMREKYLQLHLSKMIGGFIASVTAFIVANGMLSGLIGWLSPTFIGGLIIGYWTIKLNRKRKNKANLT